MRLSRFLLFLLGCFVVLGTALAQAPPPAPPPKPDKQAGDFLEKAIKELDPEKLRWVETTLWQVADFQGLTMRGEGRFLAGPDHRLRIDLTGSIGEVKGTLEVGCDGATFWEAQKLPGKDRDVFVKVDVKKLISEIQQDTAGPKALEEFFQSASFLGVAALLKTLQKRLVFTDMEPGRWQGHDVRVLTGVWPEDTVKKVAPLGRWPAYFPRQCRLYLGSQAPYWPYRLEWWGPMPPRASDGVMVQTEFRNPRWDFTLSDQQIAAEFRFDPGSSDPKDFTERDLGILKERAKQLASPEKK